VIKIAVGIFAVVIGFLTAGIAYPPPRGTPQWSVRDPILLWEEGRRPSARVSVQPSPAATGQVSAVRPAVVTSQPAAPRKVSAAPKPATQTPKKTASRPKKKVAVARASAQLRAPLDDRGL
jgi:hypothetical protein